MKINNGFLVLEDDWLILTFGNSLISFPDPEEKSIDLNVIAKVELLNNDVFPTALNEQVVAPELELTSQGLLPVFEKMKNILDLYALPLSQLEFQVDTNKKIVYDPILKIFDVV